MKELYATFRQITGLNRFTESFAKRLSPFVLCYHQAVEREMASHIRYLQRHFNIKNINELHAEDCGCCAITVDDCIREDFHQAAQIAESLACPITFYLPTRYSENNAAMWPTKWKWSMQQAGNPKWRIAFEHLCARLMHSGNQTHELELETDAALAAKGFDTAKMPDALRVISPEEVRAFRGSRFVCFESHSVTHPFLNLCTEAEIQRELLESKQFIENLTEREVNSFCYPYGSKKIIGDTAPLLAANCYQNATTLIPGIFTNSDLFQINRIGIYPGDSVKHLATKVFHYQNLAWIGRA